MDSKENKFSFNEEEDLKGKEVVEESKEAVKKDAKGLVKSVTTYLSRLLDFREDTDREATVNAIKGDIPFRGATAWILICSIFVASVGLNANSTAVVIGAMLISPLMGPILGVGLSIAINDIDTLRRSLINLLTMIVLSLITAFLFFWLFPLSEDNSELLGRTRPDIRDVLIAFFGGLALIIARTKKGTIASVIFGVAIATALMPPLCTVGYGLAVAWEGDVTTGLEYALGAMYLFTINTIFIALATFITVKILRFPMLKYANSKRRKFISRVATVLAIAVMIPAVWTFINVLRQSNFNRDAEAYINNEFKTLEGFEYLKRNATFKYIDKDNQYIEINTYGLGEIPETTIALLKNRMKDYDALKKTKLDFNQDIRQEASDLKYMEQLRYRDSLELAYKTNRIELLEQQALELEKIKNRQIPFQDITRDAQILFNDIESISYALQISTDFQKSDTIDVFSIKWKKPEAKEGEIRENMDKMEKWLKNKLELDTLVVRRIR